MSFSRIFIFIAILASGCASQPDRPQLLPQSAVRIVVDGYSVMPPKESGWLRLPQPANRLVIGKRGAGPDETFAIDAYPIELESSQTPDGFLSQVNQKHGERLPASRFKIIKSESVIDRSRGVDCAVSNIVAEDMQAARRTTSVKGAMTMEIHALSCVDPMRKGGGFTVAYSRRYYSENFDPAFAPSAKSLLSEVMLLAK